ncbi:chondroitin synthase, putative [Ixodes scapularis]|uniref:Hexosyltransferase n=1 Tax=Ixodes scapularis TaxID=6945 RepID=B7QCZ7_IXOSC|nr:chondroitin synthase, putative [Ixodes scapularis]|eukprot:XP_002413412.1 chondroitin synthase, putative [Ixodes scapularis]
MKGAVSSAVSLLAGTLIGFIATSQVLLWLNSETGCSDAPQETAISGRPKSRLLFVGVMTAEKYLSTRAVAIQRTWGKALAGRLAFFSSGTSRWENQDEELPLVALRGVDDAYPPQKKSFLMLKYMHDHYLDQYEWFMRCDDDVYVHVERLERFLRSMQTIFYHNFFGEVALKGRVRRREVHRSLTLHPELRQRSLQLLREMRWAAQAYGGCATPAQVQSPWCSGIANGSSSLSEMPSLTKYFPGEIQDLLTWDFFSKSLYSDQVTNPRRRMETFYEVSINNVISDLMELTNRYSKQRGRVIEFKDVLYGYHRLDPLHGADYVLDLLLTYRKYRGRKMTLPVRRHAYIQQPFSQLRIREVAPQRTRRPVIRFVLPLCGRRATFERFLRTFRAVCLEGDDACTLLVVQFRHQTEADDLEGTLVAEEVLGVDYDRRKVEFVPGGGEFSRAAALELGASRFGAEELLFFVDVDMVFDAGVLRRIRSHVACGRSAYFPVIFSQYDPAYAEGVTEHRVVTEPRVAPGEGYWRQFGFGIAAICRSDLAAVGGLDVTIRGWGKEDVDLYDRVVASNLTVAEAAGEASGAGAEAVAAGEVARLATTPLRALGSHWPRSSGTGRLRKVKDPLMAVLCSASVLTEKQRGGISAGQNSRDADDSAEFPACCLLALGKQTVTETGVRGT